MASRVVHLGPTWSVRTVDRVKKLVPDPEPCNYDDFAQLRADGFDGPNCDCRGRCSRLGVADLSHRPQPRSTAFVAPTAQTKSLRATRVAEASVTVLPNVGRVGGCFRLQVRLAGARMLTFGLFEMLTFPHRLVLSFASVWDGLDARDSWAFRAFL